MGRKPAHAESYGANNCNLVRQFIPLDFFISLLFILNFFMSEDQVDVSEVNQCVDGKG